MPSVWGFESVRSKRYQKTGVFFKKSNGDERRGSGDALSLSTIFCNLISDTTLLSDAMISLP